MKKYTLPTAVILMLGFVFPVSASAYFTTSQSAVILNENTVLFTVTYSFGMKRSDLHMPIGARQNSEFNAEPVYLGYEFLNNDDESVKIENVAGLVFSNSKIENNEYVVEKGTAEEFKLVVIARLSDFEINENSDISLKVTSLPFDIVNDGNELPNHLNEGEVKYYRTPEVEL